MPHFLVQWKYKPDSISAMRSAPQDRHATATKLAEAFHGTVVSFYNRTGVYDGVAIILFPDNTRAAAHSIHAMSSGAFDQHVCELLLTAAEYKDALSLSHDAVTSYQPPNVRFGTNKLT